MEVYMSRSLSTLEFLLRRSICAELKQRLCFNSVQIERLSRNVVVIVLLQLQCYGYRGDYTQLLTRQLVNLSIELVVNMIIDKSILR